MNRRLFVTTTATGICGLAGLAWAQGGAAPRPPATRPRWGQQAETEFGLGRGLGPALMTEEEWKEHQEKLRTLSPEDRQTYRAEVHEKMVERAKERGITMPAAPRGPAGGRRPAN